VLAVGACLSGTANAIWEIVKERSIYIRERSAGLSAGAYLVSKLVVLGLITGLQAVVLVLVGLSGRPLPPQGAVLTGLPLVELMLAMFALGVASMTLGLLLSSVVDTSDKAMPLLVVVVMFHVVLSGGIFPLHGKAGLEELSWFSPSRWGYAATASTANLNTVVPAAAPPGGTDPLWNHSPQTWLIDMAVVVLLALGFAVITWWRLLKMGPIKRR
jgi:ABC transport system ATP-binding/permease protein